MSTNWLSMLASGQCPLPRGKGCQVWGSIKAISISNESSSTEIGLKHEVPLDLGWGWWGFMWPRWGHDRQAGTYQSEVRNFGMYDAHQSHFTLWGLWAVGAAVRDWIAITKCTGATLLFFSCSFFTLSYPPSLSTYYALWVDDSCELTWVPDVWLQQFLDWMWLNWSLSLWVRAWDDMYSWYG